MGGDLSLYCISRIGVVVDVVTCNCLSCLSVYRVPGTWRGVVQADGGKETYRREPSVTRRQQQTESFSAGCPSDRLPQLLHRVVSLQGVRRIISCRRGTAAVVV